MKRDFDLIREILLKVEEKNFKSSLRKINIYNYSKDDIEYNVKLLIDNDFLEGTVAYTSSGLLLSIGNMTYQGHDLLDSMRDKNFFDKVKEYAKEKSVPLTLDTIKAVVPALVKSLLG